MYTKGRSTFYATLLSLEKPIERCRHLPPHTLSSSSSTFNATKSLHFKRPGVMLLYPLYASMKAIESPSTLDDQQWLTYWVLYSFLTLFELSTHRILCWFPIWGYLKLVFCIWLVLPMFNGAAYIYEKYVRQYIKNIGSYRSSNYPEEYKKVLHMMTFDARKAVERYIDRHGPEAFERAEKEAKKR
ncbi:HVA22-like protein f isoform X2 [Vigna angularis]|uniref:HVA22-like protein f isoform X2 n=1 Tax=Phaseolus angularis TaxID=3914 RepID=UPI0022B443A2|nr:HVA22-like protein f isoform X2 [Vigna angularis]